MNSGGGVDAVTPNVARVYDYLLGGKDHYACDREFASKIVQLSPDTREVVGENRAFPGRVVRYLAKRGIRQFLDIGTGLPTQQNVHEVAQFYAPGARVIYVDNDPVVLAHARALLASNDLTTVVKGDLRQPESIIGNVDVLRLIDWSRPVAVLMLAILHFVTGEHNPSEIMAHFRDRMAPGSFIAISHAEARPEVTKIANLYTSEATEPGEVRSRADIVRFFDGFELVSPGLVPVPQWRPDLEGTPKSDMWFLGGVGVKP